MRGDETPQTRPDERADIVALRVDQLRALLERRGASAILLDTRRDFAWLTMGGANHILYTTETGVAPILVTRDHAVVIAPVNEFDRIADEEIYGLPLGIEKVGWFPGAAVERARQICDERMLSAGDVADELVALRSVLVEAEHRRLAWLAGVVKEVAA